MHIIANILYIICVLFTISWGILLRHKAKTEQETEKIFEVFGLLMFVSLVLIPTLSISPFHLLWMFPVSFLVGPLTLIFPFKLLWPFASLYSSLWYIELKMTEKGHRGGLVSRIKNKHSDKKYMISTAQEIERSYWSTVIMNSKFFGLWADMYHPLYTFIRNNKEDAYVIHTTLKTIVETIPEKEWLESFPSPNPPEGYSEEAKEILKKLSL